MKTRSRIINLLVVAAIIFAVGIYLRLEAHTLCTYQVHMQGTPGTAPNAEYTDEHRFGALVDIARVLLGLAATMTAMTVAAWVFLPEFRVPGYTDIMKNFPPGSSFSRHDPDFSR